MLHHTGRDNRGRAAEGQFLLSAPLSGADWAGLALHLARVLRVTSGVLNIATADTARRSASHPLSRPEGNFAGIRVLLFLPEDRVATGQEARIRDAGVVLEREPDFAVLSLMPTPKAEARDAGRLTARHDALMAIVNEGRATQHHA